MLSMDKEVRETYSDDHPASFLPKPREISSENDIEMADYMLSNPSPHPPISFDKLSFADVMQLADFGPKLTMSQTRISDEDNYSYYPRFQMSTDTLVEQLHMPSPAQLYARERQDMEEEEEARFSENASSVQELGFAGGGGGGGGGGGDGQNAAVVEVKNRRKRPRAMKTSEEVESQRMTHIAVERNRRKQMNEHLRVLRSLMPSSYVQRGDQASIIGGAIEFVRELEQLLQCLESQKRRRIFGGGDTQRAMGDVPALQPVSQSQQQPPLFPTIPPDFEPNGLREEMAENKSCLADIEVRLLGFDAMIKILSRRRPQQLLKTIAALEEMQFCILHTNITTIEQTVLYSFNVKITGETRCTAEDIASSVHQLFSFIDASTL